MPLWPTPPNGSPGTASCTMQVLTQALPDEVRARTCSATWPRLVKTESDSGFGRWFTKLIAESMLGTGNARLPTDQVYVVVNSKLTPEFGMPERKVNSILARTIGVALTTALRAELLLVTAGAQRLGLKLSVAYVPETFQELNRGLFDHIYMQALFDFGAEQAKKGAVFENILAGAAERRTDAPR